MCIRTSAARRRFAGICGVQRQRPKGYGTYHCRGHLSNRISIEQRLAVVDRRIRLGDWELDTMIGQGYHQELVSLTERQLRLSPIAKVMRRCADAGAAAVIVLLKPLGLPLHTVTSDKGNEFVHHETIQRHFPYANFFAYPYASWE